MLICADGWASRRDSSFNAAWMARARRSLKLPESQRVPVYILSGIFSLLFMGGAYLFKTSLDNVQTNAQLSIQLAEARAAARSEQEKTLRERLEAQIRDRDAEYSRQIVQLQTQVSALVLSQSQTQGVLTNVQGAVNSIQGVITELRDAINRLPFRELPPGPSRRSALDGAPDNPTVVTAR